MGVWTDDDWMAASVLRLEVDIGMSQSCCGAFYIYLNEQISSSAAGRAWLRLGLSVDRPSRRT